MTSWNPIRDNIPIDRYRTETADGDDDSGVDTGHAQSDLVHQDLSLRDRLTPDSGWGWVAAIAGAIILAAALNWAAPLITPWVTTWPFALVTSLLATNVVNHLWTRQQMLSYWDTFDQIDLYKGNSVETIVGKVVGSAEEDPLVKRLDSVGFAGLNPTFETVDDAFKHDAALAAKVDRQQDDGSWEPARGRLDNAYTAVTDTPLFGKRLVTHCRKTRDTDYASDWEWTTLPPKTPDMDAALAVIVRDEVNREQVIPSYEKRLETAQSRIKQVHNDMGDVPHIPITKVSDFAEQFQQDGNRSNGTGGLEQLISGESQALDDVDEAVDEEMEEMGDA